MKRRELLAGMCLGSAGIAGCLGTSYEQCDLYIVNISSLPDAAQDEVDAAMKDGEYETSGSLTLPEVIDVDESYLSDFDSGSRGYFEAEVSNGESHLSLDETYPPAEIEMYALNNTENEINRDVRIEHEELNEVLIEETVELEAGGGTALDETDDHRLGTYRTHIEGIEPVEVSLRPYLSDGSTTVLLHIGEDSVNAGSTPEISQASCSWDGDGSVTMSSE